MLKGMLFLNSDFEKLFGLVIKTFYLTEAILLLRFPTLQQVTRHSPPTCRWT